MSYDNPYNSYQRATQATSEIQQVIMLYEGVINYIEQAKEAIRERNFEKRYNLISKATAIINGLASCLDFSDSTQETAKALDEFYQSIDMQLLLVHSSDSLEACDTIIDSLRTMLQAWKDISRDSNAADAQNTESFANASGSGDYPEMGKDVVITV
jgi:flagellar protein FliS